MRVIANERQLTHEQETIFATWTESERSPPDCRQLQHPQTLQKDEASHISTLFRRIGEW